MTGLLDIDGARVLLNGTLYEMVEIAVGTNLDVIWPNPFASGKDTRFFTEVYDTEDSSRTVGAEAIYDLYIKDFAATSGSGSDDPETKKNISELLRHMSLKTTSGGLPYIEIDIGLAGLSFGSFGGVNSEIGSGGGGGFTTLHDLLDTAISNPQNGQALVYDGMTGSVTYGKWKNANIPLTIDDLTDVSASSPSAGQALVYRNNVWQPETIITSVENKNADIGTSLTTIATVGDTDIKAKITHQTVELSAGSANGSLKLTVGGVAGSDVSIPGLGSLAFKSAQYIAGTATIDSAARDALLGISSISRQLTGESPAPGAKTGTKDFSFIEWDAQHSAWHFYGNIIAEGYGSFGGINEGDSGDGIGLDAVWASLASNSDSYANQKIDSHHLKLGSGLELDSSGNIIATISGTIGVSQGGTGLTSVDAFSLLYAPSNVSASNALATLAPNTSATKKYLTMTGTGSAGAAPVWGSLGTSDISDLSSWSGSSSITTLGTIGTGVWQATPIGYDYIADLYLAGTRTISSPANDILCGVTAFCNNLYESDSYGSGDPEESLDTSHKSYVYWDNGHQAWHFSGNLIAEGYGSFGGTNDAEAEDEISVFSGPWSDYSNTYANYIPTAGIVNSRFTAAETDIFNLQNTAASLAARATALEARPNIIFVAPAASYPADADMVENTLYVKLSQTSS